jgi:hypothetical protein
MLFQSSKFKVQGSKLNFAPLRLCVILFFCLVSVRANLAPLKSPSDVLGFKPGTERKMAGWQQISDYFAQLDQASERVQLQTIGDSTLGRRMFVAFISAAENIRELPKYQAIQRRLADPRLVLNNGERDKLLREGKTIVAISCSIHSTEIVASQMSLQLAYELANAEDPETAEILRNTILILIPSPNPDGIDIVKNWYDKTLGTPYEGSDPPELYNHYAGHDNNRDWFMLNLKETKNVTKLFWREWYPQIVYDVHQMGRDGARFCLPPFHEPAYPGIPPLIVRETGLLGYEMASALQGKQFKGVVTNAMFDMWWHGGFRSAPYFHNSIGILSEAASAKLMTPFHVKDDTLGRFRSRGLNNALEKSANFPDPWPGGFWSPREIMEMEMTAARALLTRAARYRYQYLSNFYELGNYNVREKGSDPRHPLAYFIQPDQGREEEIAKFIGLLIEQGVEVYRADKEFHPRLTLPLPDYVEVPAGSYLIFLRQPFRYNVQALFEIQEYPNRVNANGEAERPYDVAGWTLPQMMGIEYYGVSELRENPDDLPKTLLTDPAQARQDFRLPPADGKRSPVANPLRDSELRVGLYRSWTASMDEGWTRFMLDTFNAPYTLIRDANIRAGGLRQRFDAIILPSMKAEEILKGNKTGDYPAEYTGGITAAGAENLRRFVQEGGALIVWDDSAEFAIQQFKLPLRETTAGVPSSKFYCPGSILRVNLQGDLAKLAPAASPANGNKAGQIDVYFVNSTAFEAIEPDKVRVLATYDSKDRVLHSGWLRGAEYVADKIALAEVRQGQGKIVLFGFRPQHRGQTWGTFPLIFQALKDAAPKKA